MKPWDAWLITGQTLSAQRPLHGQLAERVNPPPRMEDLMDWTTSAIHVQAERLSIELDDAANRLSKVANQYERDNPTASFRLKAASNTLADVSFWWKEPDPKSLSDAWLQSIKDKVSDCVGPAIGCAQAAGDRETERVLREAKSAAYELATLLCKRPELSTMRYDAWESPARKRPVERIDETADRVGSVPGATSDHSAPGSLRRPRLDPGDDEIGSSESRRTVAGEDTIESREKIANGKTVFCWRDYGVTCDGSGYKILKQIRGEWRHHGRVRLSKGQLGKILKYLLDKGAATEGELISLVYGTNRNQLGRVEAVNALHAQISRLRRPLRKAIGQDNVDPLPFDGRSFRLKLETLLHSGEGKNDYMRRDDMSPQQLVDADIDAEAVF